jgi:Ca2+-binding EF-hand superfamily protein
MKFIFEILKSFGLWCLSYVFNFIDEDKDGVIEKEEVEDLIKRIKDLIKKK